MKRLITYIATAFALVALSLPLLATTKEHSDIEKILEYEADSYEDHIQELNKGTWIDTWLYQSDRYRNVKPDSDGLILERRSWLKSDNCGSAGEYDWRIDSYYFYRNATNGYWLGDEAVLCTNKMQIQPFSGPLQTTINVFTNSLDIHNLMFYMDDHVEYQTVTITNSPTQREVRSDCDTKNWDVSTYHNPDFISWVFARVYAIEEGETESAILEDYGYVAPEAWYNYKVEAMPNSEWHAPFSWVVVGDDGN